MNITPETYNQRLRSFIKELETKNRGFQVAVTSTHAKQAKRIFQEGKGTDETEIGQYNSTTPLYVDPNKTFGNTAKLKPAKGKHGDAVFKTGKKAGQPHKTTYVDSYKELRNIVGRKTDKVNLVASGELQSDFSKGNIKLSANSYQTKLSKTLSRDKVEGLEEKYGKIFSFTKTEHIHCEKLAINELINDLKKSGLA